MISWETPTGRIRVARGSGSLSPETQRIVDEAVARGSAGVEAIKRNAARRNAEIEAAR